MAYKKHFEGTHCVDCPYCANAVVFEPQKEHWTEEDDGFSHIIKNCETCGNEIIISADGEQDCYYATARD